jgi:hypothetical protein
MTSGSTWFSLGFVISAIAAQGCSSTSGPAGSADSGAQLGADSAPESDGGGAEMDSGSTSTPDAGAQMTCPAAPLSGDGGGAACTACRMTNCAAESATCATDCTCASIEQCLESSPIHNFNGCDNAINAIMGGNSALTALTDCLDGHCLKICFNQ